MSRREDHLATLQRLDPAEWPDHLRRHDVSPQEGPDLDLARAVAAAGDQTVFDALLATDEEFLVFCGVLGLGRALVEATVSTTASLRVLVPARTAHAPTSIPGTTDPARLVARLRTHAQDERPGVRQAVVLAVQALGDADVEECLELCEHWGLDREPLVRATAVASICEPRLLPDHRVAARATDLCAQLTNHLATLPPEQRETPGVRALRQALGRAWSVAVTADPAVGLPRFRALLEHADPDVRWIAGENSRDLALTRLLAAEN